MGVIGGGPTEPWPSGHGPLSRRTAGGPDPEGTGSGTADTAVAHCEEVAMIVIAGSFKRYGVPARPGESAGKVRAGCATEPWPSGHGPPSRRSAGGPDLEGPGSGMAETALVLPATIRYNAYSTSGWRSRNRHRCGQFNKSRARHMQSTLRIVKNHSRIAGAARTLRDHVDSARVTSAVAKCLSRSLSSRSPLLLHPRSRGREASG